MHVNVSDVCVCFFFSTISLVRLLTTTTITTKETHIYINNSHIYTSAICSNTFA